MIDDEEELYENSPDEQVEDAVEEEGMVTQENIENKVLNSDADREIIEENWIELVNDKNKDMENNLVQEELENGTKDYDSSKDPTYTKSRRYHPYPESTIGTHDFSNSATKRKRDKAGTYYYISDCTIMISTTKIR